MSAEPPTALERAAALRRLLRDLGEEETNPPHGAAAEIARERRMAEGMDAELSRLVLRRRQARFGTFGVIAAAAVALLAVGLRPTAHLASPSITREPLAAKPLEPNPPAPAGPELLPSATAVVVDAPRPQPRVSASPNDSAEAAPSAADSTGETGQQSPSPPVVERPSTLAEENQWFKEAAEASRLGDMNGALERLDRLLREHPQSPLAQTALVRKFRLLDKAGRTDEARGEATRYLAAYPTGFAVEEARAIRDGGPTPRAVPSQERAEP